MATPFETNEMLADAYEPKRQNRWMFQFTEDVLPTFAARTASKPNGTVETVTIDFLNSKRYLQGKFEWNTITLGLYDPIAPSASQKVMEWVRLGFETISGRSGYAAFYKKDFYLIGLDPVGTEIERWQIKGAFPSDFNFGDLDMSSGELTTIDLTIRMDQCVLLF